MNENTPPPIPPREGGQDKQVATRPGPETVSAVPLLPELKPIPIERRSFLWPVIGFLLMVLLPAAASIYYYYEIAADRYVAEFRYSVRAGAMSSGADQASGSGGGGPASTALMVAGDSFVLEDYLRSPRAMFDLEERVPLREMLARDGGDPVRMYDPDLPPEDLLEYWRAAVNVHFDVITGISAVSVVMYRPEDAKDVADALVAMLTEVVDQLSEKQQAEMLAYVRDEVTDAGATLDAINKRMEDFRSQNQILELEVTTGQNETFISELRQRQAAVVIQLDSLPASSPRRPGLEAELESINREMQEQRRTLGGGEDEDLPELLNQFERLKSEQTIALESLTSAIELERQSRAIATLGQVQLVVFVPPSLPVISTMPERWLEVLIIALVAFAVWLVLRIFMASLRTP